MRQVISRAMASFLMNSANCSLHRERMTDRAGSPQRPSSICHGKISRADDTGREGLVGPIAGVAGYETLTLRDEFICDGLGRVVESSSIRLSQYGEEISPA